MARVLDVEYGGMNDVLYELAAVTGEPSYRALAWRFDHDRIFVPLAEGRDELRGLHVNTQIPKIIGAARRWETTGDPRARAAASYFWTEVVSKRSYATGGTSNEEEWRTDPGRLASELGVYTQECCCTYNMLKLTGHVFGWTADPALRGLLRSARSSTASSGRSIPPTAPSSTTCRSARAGGSTSERRSRTSGAARERAPSPSRSSASWRTSATTAESGSTSSSLRSSPGRRRGLVLTQDTRFPEEPATRLKLRLREPRRFALRLRVPGWVGTGGGEARDERARRSPRRRVGGYVVLERTWNDGDRVEWTVPMSLRAVPMPDDATLAAVAWGPIVLAGRLGTRGPHARDAPGRADEAAHGPELKAPPVPAPDLAATRRRSPKRRSGARTDAPPLRGRDEGRRKGRARAAELPLRRALCRLLALRRLGRESLRVDARDHLERVLVVQLLEDLVRQAEAVHLPERVPLAVVVEVLVVGLEHAEVDEVLVGGPGVLPEHHAVLVLLEPGARGARLSAELGEDGADLRVDVRQTVEELARGA